MTLIATMTNSDRPGTGNTPATLPSAAAASLLALIVYSAVVGVACSFSHEPLYKIVRELYNSKRNRAYGGGVICLQKGSGADFGVARKTWETPDHSPNLPKRSRPLNCDTGPGKNWGHLDVEAVVFMVATSSVRCLRALSTYWYLDSPHDSAV